MLDTVRRLSGHQRIGEVAFPTCGPLLYHARRPLIAPREAERNGDPMYRHPRPNGRPSATLTRIESR